MAAGRLIRIAYKKGLYTIEACLAPIEMYTERISNTTAIRLATAIPENNIATAIMPQRFPIWRDFRFGTNCRLAFDANKGGMRPKV